MVRLMKARNLEPTPKPKKCVDTGSPKKYTSILMPEKTEQSQKKYTDSIIKINATWERNK
jgi:hypothetical protein